MCKRDNMAVSQMCCGVNLSEIINSYTKIINVGAYLKIYIL